MIHLLVQGFYKTKTFDYMESESGVYWRNTCTKQKIYQSLDFEHVCSCWVKPNPQANTCAKLQNKFSL